MTKTEPWIQQITLTLHYVKRSDGIYRKFTTGFCHPGEPKFHEEKTPYKDFKELKKALL